MPTPRVMSTSSDEETAKASVLDDVVEPPTKGQLKQLFVASAVPFVAFGFMDNFVMILAGDLIDSTLCVSFCFSTMAAAAVGNTLSDVVGIYSGGLIENVAERNGIKEPPLTSEQRLLKVTKVWQYTGQVIGIIFGCILGACPLLFLDAKVSVRLKREKELQSMFAEAMPDIQRIMKCEAVVLMEVNEEKELLECLSSTSNIPNIQPWSYHDGIMGHVARTGKFVNVADVRNSPLYHPPLHDDFQGSHIRARSMLCVPVLRAEKVEAVLCVLNKEEGGAFTEKDEDSLSFMASHIAVRMETVLDVQQSFTDVVRTCEKVMAKEESMEYGSHTARQRRAELYLPALNGISKVLQAQATALMLLDDSNAELYSEAIAGDLPKHKNKLGEGIAGKCAVQGRVHNVERSAREDSFDKDRHDDYLGSGIDVHSELCVPMFDSKQKCLGVIKVINKQGGGAFDAEDMRFATEVANNLAIMLEDDGGIKRVLALTRQQVQLRAATTGERADHNTLFCFLDRGQNLPDNADAYGVGIDPYVTIQIVRGNVLSMPDMEAIALKERQIDRTEVVRKFGKSTTIMQNLNPQWDETIAVTIPIEMRGVPENELFAHVLLWDYDAWKQDDLIGQAVFPLSDMPKGKLKSVKPCHLQQIPGVDDYDLSGARLWLSFSRPGTKPLGAVLSPPSVRSNLDDWAGDTFAPKVGEAAADNFKSSNDWLRIVDSVRDSLTSTCGASFADLERTRRQDDGRTVVCAVSDPRQLDCPLVYVSKGFEELTGYPRSFALGRNCRFLQPNNRKDNDQANLADRERMQSFVQGLMPEQHVLWNLLINETFDGRKFWNLLRMEFVYLGEERRPYIFAVQREFKNEPKHMAEVAEMRARLVEHEKKGTVPKDVLAWAGLTAQE